MELKTSKKPLRPKNIYSRFCVKDFVDDLLKDAYLITTKNDMRAIKAKDSKHAKSKFRKRYPSEKILTVKKIK